MFDDDTPLEANTVVGNNVAATLLQGTALVNTLSSSHMSALSPSNPSLRYDDYSAEVSLEQEDCPLTAQNYKVAASLGLSPDVMITTPLLVDTDATMNLVSLNFLPQKWHSTITSYNG